MLPFLCLFILFLCRKDHGSFDHTVTYVGFVIEKHVHDVHPKYAFQKGEENPIFSRETGFWTSVKILPPEACSWTSDETTSLAHDSWH